MRKHTKKFAFILSLLLLTLLTLFCACKKSVPTVNLTGFAPKESVEVSQGDYLKAENLFVVDEEGNMYEVRVEVLDKATNASVPLQSGGFFCDELTGYTIIYGVLVQGKDLEKTTDVIVRESTGNAFDVVYDELGKIGSAMTFSVEESAEYTYSMTVLDETGNEVTVSGLSFTPQSMGKFTVTIVRTDANGEVTQSTVYVYVTEAGNTAEVEIYSSKWQQEVEATGRHDKRLTAGWTVKNTSETGVYDRSGKEADFLTLQTNQEYVEFYFFFKENKAYYASLYEQGYRYISLWIRIDCAQNRYLEQRLGPPYGEYKSSAGYSENQIWQEIKFPLKPEGVEDWKGSILDYFEEYSNQTIYPIVINNARESSSWISGYEGALDMHIYVDDMYAVKEIAMTGNSSLGDELDIGDEIVLSDVVLEPDAYDMYVTSDGKTELANEGRYRFTANGTYTIEVKTGTGTPHLSGSYRREITVVDRNTFTGENLVLERTGNSVAVDLSALSANYQAANASNIRYRYTVSRFGAEIPVTNDAFTATKDGCYDVKVLVSYDVNGETFYSKQALTVDVFSQATKMTVFDPSAAETFEVYSYWYNSDWDAHNTYEVIGSTIKISSNTAQWTAISVKPFYSKNYYAKLLESNPYLQVNYGYSLANVSGDATGDSKNYFAAYPQWSEEKAVGSYSVEWSLQNFVKSYYDGLLGNYNYIQDLKASGTTIYLKNDSSTYARALLAMRNTLDDSSAKCYAATLTVAPITVTIPAMLQEDLLFMEDLNERTDYVMDVSRYATLLGGGSNVYYEVTDIDDGEIVAKTLVGSDTTWDLYTQPSNTYTLTLYRDSDVIAVITMTSYKEETLVATNFLDVHSVTMQNAWGNENMSVTVTPDGGTQSTLIDFYADGNVVNSYTGKKHAVALKTTMSDAFMDLLEQANYSLLITYHLYYYEAGNPSNMWTGTNMNVAPVTASNGSIVSYKDLTGTPCQMSTAGEENTLEIDLATYRLATTAYATSGIGTNAYTFVLIRTSGNNAFKLTITGVYLKQNSTTKVKDSVEYFSEENPTLAPIEVGGYLAELPEGEYTYEVLKDGSSVASGSVEMTTSYTITEGQGGVYTLNMMNSKGSTVLTQTVKYYTMDWILNQNVFDAESVEVLASYPEGYTTPQTGNVVEGKYHITTGTHDNVGSHIGIAFETLVSDDILQYLADNGYTLQVSLTVSYGWDGTDIIRAGGVTSTSGTVNAFHTRYSETTLSEFATNTTAERTLEVDIADYLQAIQTVRTDGIGLNAYAIFFTRSDATGNQIKNNELTITLNSVQVKESA